MVAHYILPSYQGRDPYIIGTVYSPPHPNIIPFPDPLTESIINIPNVNKTPIYILADVHCDYGDLTITDTQFLAGMKRSTALQQ